MKNQVEQKTRTLIRRYQQGDEAALNALLQQYHPLIQKAATRYTGNGLEYDDLYSVGMEGLWKAARQFDLDRGTRFMTVAFPSIVYRMRRKAAWGRYASGRLDVRSLETPITEDLNVGENIPSDDRPEAEVLSALTLSRLLAQMPPRTRQIVMLRLSGYLLREIGDHAGITAERVNQIIHNLQRSGTDLKESLMEGVAP